MTPMAQPSMVTTHHTTRNMCANMSELRATLRGQRIWWLQSCCDDQSLLRAAAHGRTLIGRSNQLGRRGRAGRKEKAMATTIDAPAAEELQTVHRHNRWLVIAVVVLTIALIAMGAWIIYEQVAQPSTVASDDIAALSESYTAAWNDADSVAFLELTTEGYTFVSDGESTSRTAQAAIISLGDGTGLEIREVGDVIMMSSGSDYYTAIANEVSYAGSEYVGVSTLHIVDTADGLKVAAHYWNGNF